MHPLKEHASRVSSYKAFESELNFVGLEFPIKPKDIGFFEKLNGISVNLFSFHGQDGKMRFPYYVSPFTNEKHVDLLYFENHYACIMDFDRMMSDICKGHYKKLFCKKCFAHFRNPEVLEKHVKFCQPFGLFKQILSMPPEGSIVTFENHKHRIPVPFVIYADFESILVPCNQKRGEKTTLTHEHVPCSVGVHVVCSNPAIRFPYQCFFGPNATVQFLDYLIELEEKLLKIIWNPIPLVWNPELEARFREETFCHICGNPFDLIDMDKVRDHCHMTGVYRGAAHSQCNIEFSVSKKIPIFFHNFKGYDSHLILQSIGKYDKKITVIPHSSEKYMCLYWGDHFEFKDTFQFLACSLASLVENMKRDSEQLGFPQLASGFPPESISLLLRKGVYPYEYITTFDKFQETSLPPKEAFNSQLKAESISAEDYKYALYIWDVFKCRTIEDYHNIYLKSDVLLLADIFENFRKTCLTAYGLDPAHYVSAPSLSWDSMLKLTKIELELITDSSMYSFIEKGLRGGVAMISKRYAKANNKYMKEFDPTLPSCYIMYLDANNLYGYAMSQTLPMKEFAWVPEDAVSTTDFLKLDPDSDTGYILEVDLHYPSALHDAHNEYPLAPERLVIEREMLSNQQLGLAYKYGVKYHDATKLVPNLMDKTKYIFHLKLLQLYIRLGLVLTNIHRVLSFKQSRWLQPYIALNTEKRAQASSQFDKDFYKLMNNAIYGKTCENLRKRSEVKIVKEKRTIRKLLHKPNCKGFKIFDNNLVGINLSKCKLLVNKPTYVGFAVLELSKHLMFDFHYNFIKFMYGSKAELLFTDTDSLMYEIVAADVPQTFFQNKMKFDFSNYSKESPYFDPTNKAVIGKFKDEAGGIPVTEFVGLKPKMYSYLKDSDESSRRAKGIQKSVVKEKLSHQSFLMQLFSPEQNVYPNRRIQSMHHHLYTLTLMKKGLSSFDDKRFLLSDGIHTLAHGHYRVSELIQSSRDESLNSESDSPSISSDEDI